MNPKIKTELLTALRSGEYKQARGYLKLRDGFCCLGVLCAIQGAEEDELLSQATSKVRPKYSAGLDHEAQERLATFNDRGSTFDEIADIIEKDY